MRMRRPFAAMNGMRRLFFTIRGSDEAPANRKPEAPAIASAGTTIRKPQGIASFTMATTAAEANNSDVTVESQKLRIVTNPIVPAIGCSLLRMVVSIFRSIVETLSDAPQRRCGGFDLFDAKPCGELIGPCALTPHGRGKRRFPGGAENNQLGALMMRIGRQPHQVVTLHLIH